MASCLERIEEMHSPVKLVGGVQTVEAACGGCGSDSPCDVMKLARALAKYECIPDEDGNFGAEKTLREVAGEKP